MNQNSNLNLYSKNLEIEDFTEESQKFIKEYICHLCNGVLHNPLVDKCGHAFCSNCILKHLESNQCCPISNLEVKISDLLKIELVIEYLNKQIVYCKNSKKGCQWKGEVFNLFNHMESTCTKQKIKCTNFQCEEKLDRDYLNVHLPNCHWRLVKCEFCTDNLPYIAIQEHLEICENFPLLCPNNCGIFSLRMNKKIHMLEKCSETLIDCPFKVFNCECENKIKRKDMQSYSIDRLNDHLFLLYSRLWEENQKNVLMGNKLEEIKNFFFNSSDFQEIDFKICQVVSENQILKEEVNSLKLEKENISSDLFNLRESVNLIHNNFDERFCEFEKKFEEKFFDIKKDIEKELKSNLTFLYDFNITGNENKGKKNFEITEKKNEILFIQKSPLRNFREKKLNLPNKNTSNFDINYIDCNQMISPQKNFHSEQISKNNIFSNLNNENFINNSDKITKNYGSKKNSEKLKEINLDMIIDNKESTSKNKKQFFDYTILTKECEILDDKIIKCVSNNRSNHKFIFGNSISDDYEKFSFKITLVNKINWLAFGLCQKEIVVKNKFRFVNYENKIIFDHGCFLLTSKSFSFNRNNVKEDNLEVKDMKKLSPGDVIDVTYYPKYGFLKFYVTDLKKNTYIYSLSEVWRTSECNLSPVFIFFNSEAEILVEKY